MSERDCPVGPEWKEYWRAREVDPSRKREIRIEKREAKRRLHKRARRNVRKNLREWESN